MAKYQDLVQKLYQVSRFRSMKLGLLNTKRLQLLLGMPDSQFKSVHIAGTNGKGSVSTKIAKALELSGKKVGLYTSPHISTFRERVQVNGKLISENEVEQHLNHVFDLAHRHEIPATFFEITTLMALSFFAHQKVDWAVIEVGLGGRLDATNIIQPNLSVITSIGMDHMDMLGNTIDAIASEKAGIIKAGVPVVVGPNVPHHVTAAEARACGSRHIVIQGPFSDFDQENSKIAEVSLEELGRQSGIQWSPSLLTNALQSRPPCRFELTKTTTPSGKSVDVLMDVAHNPPAFARLFQKIKHSFPSRNIRLVVGFSGEKDAAACLKEAAPFISSVHFVHSPHPRATLSSSLVAMANQLKTEGLDLKVEPLIDDGNIRLTTEAALQCASLNNDLVVVCGTFYILKDVRTVLSIHTESDAFDLHEYTKPASQ